MSDSKTAPLAGNCTPSATKYCGPENYPACRDLVSSGAAVLAEEMYVVPTAKGDRFIFLGSEEKAPEGAVRPSSQDNPETPANESQVNKAWYGGYVGQRGYEGICRHEAQGKKGEMEESWFGYMGYPRFLALRNTAAENSMMDQSEVSVPANDMEAIIKFLGLSERDVAIKPGGKPVMGKDGKFGPGIYHFANSYTRVGQIVDQLDKSAMLMVAMGVGRDSIYSVYNHLKTINKPADSQLSAMEDQSSMWIKMLAGQFVLTALTTIPLLAIFYKQLKMAKQQMGMMGESLDLQRKMMEGDSDKNKLEKFASDLVANERGRLEADIVSNEVRGRDAEAVEFLKRLSRPRYANPMLVGPSGVGKDKIVERAAQLIALRDPRVPRQFLDGTIKGVLIVDPSAFSANTGIRGDSAARANEIIRAMNEGYAVYFPEIADFLSSGAASEGASESLGSQLKDALTRGTARFAGSTTPGSFQSLVRRIPWLRDITRRMPAMEVKDLTAKVINEIVPKSMVSFYEDYYGVKIEKDAVDAAINLGLNQTKSDDSHARMDSIDQILVATIESTADIKRTNGDPVKIEWQDVIDTVVVKTGMAEDEVKALSAKFEETVPDAVGAGSEMSFVSVLEAEMNKDSWFRKLDEPLKRDALRLAGAAILGQGGERFRKADGAIDVRALVGEVKPRLEASHAADASAAGTGPSSASASSSSDSKVETIRKTLIREAELAESKGIKLGFDIRTLRDEDQVAQARRAYEMLDRMDQRLQARYLVAGEGGRAKFRDGAAHKLLIEAVQKSKDPDMTRGQVGELCRELDKTARAAERASEKARSKGWFDFLRRGK